MATLGDILAGARREAANVEQWLAKQNIELYLEAKNVAIMENVQFAEFVRLSVSDFSRFASEEHWATLMGRIRKSDEPGTACLTEMLRWRIEMAAHQNSGAVKTA